MIIMNGGYVYTVPTPQKWDEGRKMMMISNVYIKEFFLITK